MIDWGSFTMERKKERKKGAPIMLCTQYCTTFNCTQHGKWIGDKKTMMSHILVSYHTLFFRNEILTAAGNDRHVCILYSTRTRMRLLNIYATYHKK